MGPGGHGWVLVDMDGSWWTWMRPGGHACFGPLNMQHSVTGSVLSMVLSMTQRSHAAQLDILAQWCMVAWTAAWCTSL
jgi:hypothetical protein